MMNGESELTELSRQGLALYDAQLKALLEPAHNTQFVAIHVDTGDYAVGRSSGSATQALLRRHPIDCRLVVRKIGPEPEYGLAVLLINKDPHAVYSATVSVSGYRAASHVTAYAYGPDSRAVTPSAASATSGRLTLTVPPYSLLALVLTRGR